MALVGFKDTLYASNVESRFEKDLRQVKSLLSLACEKGNSYGEWL